MKDNARRNNALLTAVLIVSPVLALAQSVDVILKGVVKDASGAVLPGVIITATNKNTNLTRSIVSDRTGHYTLPPIPAGTYDVSAELTGFSNEVRRNQVFHVGTEISIDFTLRAAASETIVVTAAAPILETTKNTLSRLVQKDEIDTLPVITRSFNNLAILSPGVSNTGVFGGVDISGSRDFQNGLNVDGLSAKRNIVGDQRINFSQDWIQEFQVLTNQFPSEFGMASGGVLNVITRSGTNQLSGRAYGFMRKDAWDAKPEFATRRPPLDEKRFGVTLGGPFVRDRMFFFTGYEDLNNKSSNIVTSAFPSANGTFPFKNSDKLFLLKLDFRPTSSSTIETRYNREDQDISGNAIGGIFTEEHGRFSKNRNYDILGNWTQIITPALFNEARAAFDSTDPKGGCNYATRNPIGTWFERSYPSGRFGCPVNFGEILEQQIQLLDNLSWTRGRHDIKGGIQALRTRLDLNFHNFRDGQYIFGSNVAFDPNNPASFPIGFQIIQGPTTANIWSWAYGTFIQDSWRMSEVFTLNLGLRYDLDKAFSALNPRVRLDKALHTIHDDTNNIAPRVGFAWTPLKDNKRTLIRGGAGLYYDQNHTNLSGILLLNNILVDKIIAIFANSPILNPFWPDVTKARQLLADALARNTIPDVSGIPGFVGGTNDLDQNLRIPATAQVTLGVAREFTGKLSASADLVYAHGFDQLIYKEVNVDRDAAVNQHKVVRINPNYSGIGQATNGGKFNYRAVQLQANYRPSSRHLLKLAYTWAKNESNTVLQVLTGGFVTNPFDLEQDKGPTDNDVRHTLSLNGSTVLPFGFEFSGIAYYRSAPPYSAFTPRLLGPGPFSLRAEPRNHRRGDDFFSLDARLGKSFGLGGRASATVFVEGFNLTNSTNFGGYIGNIDVPQFGQPTTAFPKRRTQVGLRVDF